MKDLDPNWNTNSNPFTNWTWAPYFRSFWAKNPALTTDDFVYTDFNGASNGDYPAGNKITGMSNVLRETDPNYTYAHENATLSNSTNNGDADKFRTQVIVAAQLVDSEGTPLNVAEWRGFKYVSKGNDESNLEELKKAIANLSGLYKKKTETDGDTYVSIEPTDIDFVTANAYKKAHPNSYEVKETFYVVPVKVGTGQWYLRNDDANGNVTAQYTEVNAAEIEEIFEKIDPIKIWKTGFAYYYIDLKHLNPTAGAQGEYGVIRNHWYDIDLSKVVNLGTPVYDPKEEIIPRDPDYLESYLAAKINILSWRIVPQTGILGK